MAQELRTLNSKFVYFFNLVASMHMLKLQCLTAKLGKTAWNDLSSMHVPDKATLGVLHSQIMAQELRTLNSKFVYFFNLKVFIKE